MSVVEPPIAVLLDFDGTVSQDAVATEEAVNRALGVAASLLASGGHRPPPSVISELDRDVRRAIARSLLELADVKSEVLKQRHHPLRTVMGAGVTNYLLARLDNGPGRLRDANLQRDAKQLFAELPQWRREVWSEALDRHGVTLSASEVVQLSELTIEERWAPGGAVFVPGAETLFVELHSRGIRTALVTDGIPQWQQDKIDQSAQQLGRFVDTAVISGEIGVRKPSPVPYWVAVSRLGLGEITEEQILADPTGIESEARSTAHHVAMVGDRPDPDLSGAERAGIPEDRRFLIEAYAADVRQDTTGVTFRRADDLLEVLEGLGIGVTETTVEAADDRGTRTALGQGSDEQRHRSRPSARRSGPIPSLTPTSSDPSTTGAAVERDPEAPSPLGLIHPETNARSAVDQGLGSQAPRGRITELETGDRGPGPARGLDHL